MLILISSRMVVILQIFEELTLIKLDLTTLSDNKPTKLRTPDNIRSKFKTRAKFPKLSPQNDVPWTRNVVSRKWSRATAAS